MSKSPPARRGDARLGVHEVFGDGGACDPELLRIPFDGQRRRPVRQLLGFPDDPQHGLAGEYRLDLLVDRAKGAGQVALPAEDHVKGGRSGEDFTRANRKIAHQFFL